MIRPNHSVNVGGNVEILTHPAGRRDVVLTREVRHNVVVDNGIILLRDLVGGTGFRPSHVGVGTDGTTETTGNSSIGTEVHRGIVTRRVDIATGIRIEFFLSTADANGNTLEEAGLLETGAQNGNPGDPATLFARVTFTPIVKTVAVEATINWSITFVAV